MTFLLLILFVFCLTLTITNFQKAHMLKDYTTAIRGRVIAVESTDKGVFFDIEYDVEEQKEIYKHRFSKSPLPEAKLAFLIGRFVGNPFYLIAKVKDKEILDVNAYSNSKITRWGFLLVTIIFGYFLFPI